MKKESKNQVIRVRVTDNDKAIIIKAAEKMHKTTGAKPDMSRVIRESVRQYLENK